MTKIVYEKGTAVYKTWLDKLTGDLQIINGAYDPFTDRIRVWCDGRTEDEARSTIRHELQHAHDRWLLIVFKLYCWIDLGMCGILLGQVLIWGNSVATIVGMLGTVILFFVAGTVHLWFEERAQKAAKNQNSELNAHPILCRSPAYFSRIMLHRPDELHEEEIAEIGSAGSGAE